VFAAKQGNVCNSIKRGLHNSKPYFPLSERVHLHDEGGVIGTLRVRKEGGGCFSVTFSGLNPYHYRGGGKSRQVGTLDGKLKSESGTCLQILPTLSPGGGSNLLPQRKGNKKKRSLPSASKKGRGRMVILVILFKGIL